MTTRVCTVDGCGTPIDGTSRRGFCARHYKRWLRYDDPTAPPRRPGPRQRDVSELFWSKVDLDGPVPAGRPELGPCWIWTGATRNGYGAFNVPATTDSPRYRVDAHRWAYEQHAGPIPDGHELMHLCHAADLDQCDGGTTCPHRACVNPGHLAIVRHQAVVRSIAAVHAAQTTCPRGHRYDRVTPSGRRRCSTCDRATADRIRTERNNATDARLTETTDLE